MFRPRFSEQQCRHVRQKNTSDATLASASLRHTAHIRGAYENDRIILRISTFQSTCRHRLKARAKADGFFVSCRWLIITTLARKKQRKLTYSSTSGQNRCPVSSTASCFCLHLHGALQSCPLATDTAQISGRAECANINPRRAFAEWISDTREGEEGQHHSITRLWPQIHIKVKQNLIAIGNTINSKKVV